MRKLIVMSALLAMCLNLLAHGQSNSTSVSMPEYTYSALGYTYKNLTIFLIQGQDGLSRNYITLEEALSQKKITLFETGSVGELSVDNLSMEYVFIMAGEIVKGGRQDRTIGEDIVLLPGAKKVPLKSFCVEQSRWGNRGGENAAVFSSSEQMLNNKGLKLAARANQNQSMVWNEVSRYQDNASARAESAVRSRVSPTSLQLTLENEKIKSGITEYVNALQPAFDGKNDILGFAFFINGKISTVEIFGKAVLFRKLQRKLLEAAASEAFEQYDDKLGFIPPTQAMLKTFIDTADKGIETAQQTSTYMIVYTRKTQSSILMSSVSTDGGKAVLHISIYSTEGMLDEDNSGYSYGGIQYINRR